MGAHIATEKYLSEKSGNFTYTAVREGLYSESFPIYTAWFDLKNPADEVTIPHPGSGPGVAWAKKDELGEATAKLIVKYTQDPSGFPYLNGEILLSGPRELSLSDTVDVLGRAVGKPLKIREISVNEYASLPQIGKKHTYHGVDLSRSGPQHGRLLSKERLLSYLQLLPPFWEESPRTLRRPSRHN